MIGLYSAAKRAFWAGLLGLTLLAGVLLAVAPAPAAHAAPVGCTSDFYYASSTNQIRSRTPSGAINVINTGTLSTLTIALNPVDGKLYGFATNGAGLGNHLFRIEADGTNADLGAITGVPAGTYNAAGFDDTGTLWIGTGGTTMYRVDVAALTATSLTLSSGVLSDFAFIDGSMYAGFGFTQLARVDLTTGHVTTAAVPGWSIPTSFWSVDGHLYVNFGTSIREVLNYATATPTIITVASGLPGPITDGASCVTAASPFLNAVNDNFSATPVTTAAGGTVSSVLTNDLNDGAALSSSDVTTTLQSDGGLAGAALTPDGSITVPAGTTAGSYTLGYQICLTTNTAVCDTATALVAVQVPPSSTRTGSGGLPVTGVSPTPLGTGAAALLALGTILLLAARFTRRLRAPVRRRPDGAPS